MANRIASGTFKDIIKKMRSLRGLNVNPALNNENVTQLTPEDKIVALARMVYGTPEESRTRNGLEVGLEAKRELYKQSPTEELENEIALEEKQLGIFDQTIEQIKQEEVVKNAEEARALYEAVENAKKILETTVEDFEKNIQTIIDCIEKDEKNNIYTMVNLIRTKQYPKYETELKKFNEAKKAYNDFQGKEEYTSEPNTIKLSEEQVEKIYRGLKNQMNELIAKRFNFSKNKYLKEYQVFIDNMLPNLLGDKDKYKEIRDRVDAELAQQHKNPIEEAKKEVKQKIDELVARLFEQYKEEFKNYKITLTTLDISTETCKILDVYDMLSSDDKIELTDYAIAEFKKLVQNEYSKELLEAVNKMDEIKHQIDELAKVEYTDPSFQTKYDALVKNIADTMASDIFKKVSADIIYDSVNQKVHFHFKNGEVVPVHFDVVSEAVKQQMKKPQIDPVKQSIDEAYKKLEAKLTEIANTRPGIVNKYAAKLEFQTIIDQYDNIPEDKKTEMLQEYMEKYHNLPQEKTNEVKIAELLDSLFAQHTADIKRLDFNIDSLYVAAQVGNLIDSDSSLNADQKHALIQKAVDEFKAREEKEFGKELLDVIKSIKSIKGQITELAKVEYTDPSFKAKYDALLEDIKKLSESDEIKKLNGDVVVDKESQKVHFIIRGETFVNVTFDLVPEKVKEQMKKATKPKPNPPTPPTPVEDEEKEKAQAISEYMELLKEIRKDIDALNHINSSIEAAASITFDTITSDTISSVMAMENSALGFDAAIINKRLELSNARANLRIKYNCYVSTLDEVKNFQMPKISFGKDYKEFVEYYDRMITIAETKIKELDKERNADYTPETRAIELTDQMRKLVNYIETVNSLINRRIVAASIEQDIDIVAFLKERAENKKAIRQEIQEMLAREIANRPKVNQKEEELKLTEQLREIYKEWLEQIKLSLSSTTIIVDNHKFADRVKEIVEKSPAQRKYEIAKEFADNFERDKSQVAKDASDNLLRFEIRKVLETSMLKVLMAIREGADYTNLENLAFTEEVNNELERIMATITLSPNKGQIFVEEKNAYLEAIKKQVKKEKIEIRRKFEKEIAELAKEIEALEINDEFETHVIGKYETLILKYKTLLGKIELQHSIKDNRLSYTYSYFEFNGTVNETKIAHLELIAMSEKKHQAYLEFIKGKDQKPPVQPKPEPAPEVDITEKDILNAVIAVMSFNGVNHPAHLLIQLLGYNGYNEDQIVKIVKTLEDRNVIKMAEDGKAFTRLLNSYEEYTAKYHNANTIISPKVTSAEAEVVRDIRVNNNKTLKFVSTSPQHATKLNGKILTADAIQLTLLKNGLKIKYSENLRRQLHELNAKLSLVNKENYRSRTSAKIEDTDKEQEVTFKRPGMEINPADYKIQIRTDRYDENGKKLRGTDLLFEMDIDQELAEEMKPKSL